MAVVRAFTLLDLEAYHKSLLPTLKKQVAADANAAQVPGLERYLNEQRVFDREAFRNATPEQRQNIDNFSTVVREPLFFCVRGNVLCIGSQENATRQVMELMAKGDLASAPLLPGHDVAARLDVQGLMAQLRTPKGSVFQELREKVTAGLGAAHQPPAAMAIFDAELDALEGLSAQIQRLDLVADATASDLKTAMTLTALPETPLARYLASVPAGLPEGLKYIPQDCWLVGALRLGDAKPLFEWSAQLQKRMALAGGKTPEQAEALAANTRAMQIGYGDQFTLGLRSGPGLRIIEVARLKDVHLPAQVQAQVTQMGGQMFGGMQDMKVTVTPSFQDNGHTINEWQFAFTPPAANAAPDPMKEMQRAMVSALFGDPLTVDYTLMGNDWLISAGPDALKSLKNILNEEAAPVTTLQSFKDLTQTLPAQTQGFMLLHLTEVVNWAQPFIKGLGGMLSMLQPPAPIARGPGLVVVISGTPTSATATLTVPAGEIRALVEGFHPKPPPK